jgi:hypothetical protein
MVVLMRKVLSGLMCVFMMATSACAVSGVGHYVVRPNVESKGVTVKKVALVPSESHAQVVDAEKWQQKLYGIVQREMKAYGLELVAADAAKAAFAKAGLEFTQGMDTRAAYSQVAQELGVDVVLVPELTLHSNSTAVLNIGSFDYEAAVSFAVYSAQKKEFVGIIEGHGTRSYATGGILTVGALASAVIASGLTSSEKSADGSSSKVALATAGGAAAIELIVDLVLTRRDRHWEQAIDEATRDGLSQFFKSFELKRLDPAPEEAPPMETDLQNGSVQTNLTQ